MAEQFGPYRLEALLGRGGMGEVHRAYDTVRHRTVALKRLPVERADDPEFQARFRRESALAAQLSEPHIIPIHDFGEIDGQLYIDMRLVEGTDLASVVARGGPMSPRRAVGILGQVASALDAAHADGLVHRDVKPSNVIVRGLDEDEFAYLIDFGIAWSATGSSSSAQLTAAGATVGTLDYMAPERFAGTAIDGRADVYSLACVLFELLTGRPPFPGLSTLALLHAHVAVEPPRPSTVRADLPPGLDAVVLRGMAKEPAHRYATAGELVAAARAALRLHTPPPGAPRALPTPPPGRRVSSSGALSAPSRGAPGVSPQGGPPGPPHVRYPPPGSVPPPRGVQAGPVPSRPPLSTGPAPPELLVALLLQAAAVVVGLVVVAVALDKESTTDIGPVGNVLAAFVGAAVVISVAWVPYLVFGLLTFRGRNWARIVITVMSALWTVGLVVAVTAGIEAVAATVVQAVMLVASIVLPFTPRANRYFAAVEQQRLARIPR